MNTRDFSQCVTLQAETINSFQPDVLVGSSFGGAVAVELLSRGLWRGATLLLAQAARMHDRKATLPEGVRVWLVHGVHDDVVPIDDSRSLARTGSAGLVRLIEVDDGHSLHSLVENGDLLRLVQEIHAANER